MTLKNRQNIPHRCSSNGLVPIPPDDAHPSLEWPTDDDIGMFIPGPTQPENGANREDSFLCSEQPNGHLLIDVKYVGTSCWYPGDRLVREHALGYAVEMVMDGRGLLVSGGQRYELLPGDIFILHPGEHHLYQAVRSIWRKHFISFRARDERIAYVMNALGLSGVTRVRLDANRQAQCRDLLARMQACARQMQPRFHVRVSHMAHELLLLMTDAVFDLDEKPRVHPYVAHAITHAHEALGSAVSVEGLARKVGCSACHLSRMFKQNLNMTAHEWLERFRLRCAAMLLCKTSKRVQDIAEDVGYSDPYYFSAAFRRVAGVCPRAYRGMSRIGRGRPVKRAAR